MRDAPKFQQGAVAVEFALVSVLFVTLLMTILGFGHWMYTMEMVADATRMGARMAVVCNINAAAIKQRIEQRVPQLSLASSQISLQYSPSGCVKDTCQSVEVSLSGVSYSGWIPFLPASIPLPPFSTTLPRESLESVDAAGEVNPVCS